MNEKEAGLAGLPWTELVDWLLSGRFDSLLLPFKLSPKSVFGSVSSLLFPLLTLTLSLSPSLSHLLIVATTSFTDLPYVKVLLDPHPRRRSSTNSLSRERTIGLKTTSRRKAPPKGRPTSQRRL